MESKHWAFEGLEINPLQTVCIHIHPGKSSYTPKSMCYPSLIADLVNHASVDDLKKLKSLSHVRLFVTPWTIYSHMELSRREYWNG